MFKNDNDLVQKSQFSASFEKAYPATSDLNSYLAEVTGVEQGAPLERVRTPHPSSLPPLCS